MAELPGKNIRRGPPAAVVNRAVVAPRPSSARAEQDADGSNVPQQRGPARRATRATATPGIPLSYKIVGSILLITALALIFGYGPYMRYRLTATLDSAPTIQARIQAADDLYARRDGHAYSVFHQRLNGLDAQARDASAYGMSLIASENAPLSLTATEELAAALPKLDPLGKCVIAKALGSIAKSIPDRDDVRKLTESNSKKLATIANALIPEVKNSDPLVRSEAIDTLAEAPSPNVCSALVWVAGFDPDASIKAKARAGISPTVLPDAAINLLEAMASHDVDLKKEASAAFKKVREKARTEDLVLLLKSPDEGLRKEIVAAMGRRPADSKAAEGVLSALKDSSAENRKLALKALQVTGVNGSAPLLLPLISDVDEAVRVQCAETLGELRDDGSKKILLEAFAANPEGETLKALSAALGKRSNGKDLPVIAVLIAQMNKRSEAFSGIREALVKLTNAHQGGKRDVERLQWDAAKWNSWWENISQREKLKDEAVAQLKKADARKQGGNKYYAELSKMTNDAFDLLEKCIKMCEPDDLEDVSDLTAIQNKFKGNKYQFEKFQVLDEYREKK